MQIQTMSIVVGDNKCNAICPFCISRQTGLLESTDSFNYAHEYDIKHNLEKACKLADIGGTTTVLLTGKGEPTLHPDEIKSILSLLRPWKFPFIELQTNGIELYKNICETDTSKPNRDTLELWKSMGLTTIIISVVSYSNSENQKVMHGKELMDIRLLCRYLKDLGFLVRLNCTMLNGYIDSVPQIKKFIAVVKDLGVHQITFRPVKLIESSANPSVAKNTEAYLLDDVTLFQIENYFDSLEDRKIMSLMHDANVYDIDGVSVCYATCLTHSKKDMRQIIFYNRTGKLTYDWEFDGAILLPEVVKNKN